MLRARRQSLARMNLVVCSTVAGLAATLGCLIVSNPSYAQEVKPQGAQQAGKVEEALVSDSSVVYVVAKIKNEQKKASEEVDQAESEKQKLAAELQELETKRDDIDHRARIFNDSEPAQQVRADLANYKATCEGRRVYGADVSRCDNLAESIKPRLKYNNDTMGSFFAQFHTAENEIQDKKNEIVLKDARITKLKNYLSWLAGADNKISTTLHQDCTGLQSNPTLEELKHRCGNIQFDNERTNLQPCETDACQAWVMYLKPQRTPEQAIQDYKNSGPPSPAAPNRGLDKSYVPPPTSNPK